jgi:hypothetical protein
MGLFTKEMIEKCIDDGVPDDTIIAPSPQLAAAVKAVAKEIHETLPFIDRSRIEKVLWRRLIDKGAVVAIINLGKEH